MAPAPAGLEPVLPCGHLGVKNIENTVNRYAYECPRCGEQFTRGEL